MLMELALDSRKGSFFPWQAVKICFTPVWASSKLPRTAHTATLFPSWVTICARCTWLTPP